MKKQDLYLIALLTIFTCCLSCSNYNIKELKYENFKGEPIVVRGVATIKYSYGKDSTLRTLELLDTLGNLIKQEENGQASKWEFNYDKNGNFVKQTEYNSTGGIMNYKSISPILAPIKHLKYNSSNQLVEQQFHDELDQPAIFKSRSTFPIMKFKYNEKGQLSWVGSFNNKGEMEHVSLGYRTFEYYENGNLLKMSNFYKEGKLFNFALYKYDDNNNLLEEKYFNPRNEYIGGTQYTYNGNIVVRTVSQNGKNGMPKSNTKMITLNVEGWKIDNKDYLKLYDSLEESGRYEIKINEEGKIIDLNPIKRSLSLPLFNMKLYDEIRNITLIKTNDEQFKLEGTLEIVGVEYENKILKQIEQITNPKPKTEKYRY